MVVPHLRIRSPIPTLRPHFRAVRRYLPPLNFITIHYAYFVGTCLISAVIFWGSSTPSRSVSFTDSLFLTTSAMTLAGLNTVNLSTLNTFQQFILFFLIMIGSAIFVSAFVVHVRRRAFEVKFRNILKKEQERARARSSWLQRRSISRPFPRHRSERPVTPTPAQPPNDTSATTDGQLDPEVKSEDEKAETLGLDGQTHGTADNAPHIQWQDGAALAPSDAATPDDHPRGRVPTRSPISPPGSPGLADGGTVPMSPESHISFGTDTIFRMATGSPEKNRHHHRRLISLQGVGAHPNASLRGRSSSAGAMPPFDIRETGPSLHRQNTNQYFDSEGFIDRNSQFHHLTEEERERLGGIEYKAIRILAWIVPLYFFLFQLLGALGIGAYVANNRPNTARTNGLNPWWVGSFNAISAFNNSGMSLLDANMVAFQTSFYMLITMSLLILAGNTCYPIFLRLIVWTLRKCMPDNDRFRDHRRTLRFLLDHPRRCYTNLFPSQHTWWLLLVVIMLNGIDWAAFEILNIGNKAITSIPLGYEVIDGLFQAFAVRSGGFYVVSISQTRLDLQVLYVIMMYVSVYPVVITMRNSNVYEERSLGIYADDPGYAAADDPTDSSAVDDSDQNIWGKLRKRASFLRPTTAGSRLNRTSTSFTHPPPNQHQTKSYFVRTQLRAQLAHDLWWIVLAIFLVSIIETSSIERDPVTFSIFNIIFETVSAYGCVGISVGLPNEAYSFCGAWSTLSKLVLCLVMLRGRHRGLPVAIDKAVLLPGEVGERAEEEDARIRSAGGGMMV